MKTDILLLTGEYPSIGGSDEPKGSYFYDVSRYLCIEAGMRIHVLAFRIGDQEYFEERDGLSVERIDLPRDDGSKNGTYKNDSELLYAHHTYDKAVTSLAANAVRIAKSCERITPVWCHGIETSEAAMEMRKEGYPVVWVAHHLVAYELMQRLEASDDPLRSKSFAHTMSYRTGALIPRKYRAGFVRFLAFNTPIISRLPLPASLEQLRKFVSEVQLMNAAHFIIAVSPSSAASAARFYPQTRNKLRISLAGAPSPSVESYWPFPVRDDRLRLVMVGRPSPHKGWDYVAAALKNLELNRPNEASKLEFVAIGGLEEWGGAFGHGVNGIFQGLKRVSFFNMEWQPNEKVLQVMSAADALLMPSIYETFGLVLVEAMANGCMVLASDADGPRDIVKAPWGMIMDFQDPGKRIGEIERGVLKLLSMSREEINMYGEQARVASRKYNWSECAEAHAAVLEEARLQVSGGG